MVQSDKGKIYFACVIIIIIASATAHSVSRILLATLGDTGPKERFYAMFLMVYKFEGTVINYLCSFL